MKRFVNPNGVPPDGQDSQQPHRENNQFKLHLAILKEWSFPGEVFPLPAEPHRVVFWSCTWGVNITLQWPAPLTPATPTEAGISWAELAVSFMLWAGRYLPIKISDGQSHDGSRLPTCPRVCKCVKKRLAPSTCRKLSPTENLAPRDSRFTKKTRLFLASARLGSASLP